MGHNYKKIMVALFTAAATTLSSQIPMAWAQRYNAPPDMTDEARSIAVDASGNVYVTGSGFNMGGNLDAITIKYDPTGSVLWVRNYDRGLSDNDEGRMLALDASGNVYVTGYSRGSGTSLDAVTIKYDNAGNQQWASFYNGTFNGIDEGRSIAVNAAGDVFICGYTSDSLYFYNALTIKYNSAGTQQWVQVYDGAISGNDELLELVIDATSNVYVTGNTEASAANYDFLTIKYNAGGTQQWLRTYDGPAASGDYGKGITLDMNGNVIVTGYSFQTNQWFDYLTIKYSNAGTQQWTARYSFGSNRYEESWDVVTDNAGYIYITGQSQQTGNNSAPTDCATVKYSPAGGQVWAKRWDGGFTTEDRAYGIALDDTANVYITGYSKSASNLDCVTIKYDSSGTEEWAVRYNSQYNQDDVAYDIAVANGSVYITGKSLNSVNEDYITVRYSYTAVGIAEVPADPGSMSIYPVPFSSTVNFDFNTENGTPESTLTITDITGRIVFAANLAEGTKHNSIDLSFLSAGTYVVTQSTPEGTLLDRRMIVRE